MAQHSVEPLPSPHSIAATDVFSELSSIALKAFRAEPIMAMYKRGFG
jgi:hypothetical protein